MNDLEPEQPPANMPSTAARVKHAQLLLKKQALTKALEARPAEKERPQKADFSEPADVTATRCLELQGIWLATEKPLFQERFFDQMQASQKWQDELQQKQAEPDSFEKRLAVKLAQSHDEASQAELKSMVKQSAYYQGERKRAEDQAQDAYAMAIQAHEATVADRHQQTLVLEQLEKTIAETAIEVQAEEQYEKNWQFATGNFSADEPESGKGEQVPARPQPQ